MAVSASWHFCASAEQSLKLKLSNKSIVKHVIHFATLVINLCKCNLWLLQHSGRCNNTVATLATIYYIKDGATGQNNRCKIELVAIATNCCTKSTASPGSPQSCEINVQAKVSQGVKLAVYL